MVTGGAGFIGSHIVEALWERGDTVAALDDLSTGRRENLPEGVVLYQIDVRDRAGVLSAFKQFAPTHVSHHAAQASVKRSAEDPHFDADVNLLGGLNVLDAAREQAVELVVFASTGGALYGEVPPGQRADESWPARPKSPYAAGKAAFEQYLDVYRQTFGLASTVLRYANVYGPRQDPHGEAGVVAIFSRRVLEQQPLTLYARREPGDGGCIRDYVHVSDVVKANLMALSGSLAGVYNVGTGWGSSTEEVLFAIGRAAGFEPRVGYAPPRLGDLGSSVLEPAKLMAAGWRVDVGLEEGIAKTLEWFRGLR